MVLPRRALMIAIRVLSVDVRYESRNFELGLLI